MAPVHGPVSLVRLGPDRHQFVRVARQQLRPRQQPCHHRCNGSRSSSAISVAALGRPRSGSTPIECGSAKTPSAGGDSSQRAEQSRVAAASSACSCRYDN